ncbi:General vesicular transport factor p115-like protein [Melia azedarach]|uniref:General vesicular transport factor p115-like protein n=1 Tax=Melia azedarach TaxID=155640 RepID=A0ACC1XVJ1_MELAZ|nr:General vesicular transport factor p115-like protein [Melia azedarach]
MDPRYTGEILKHLEKQNELLTEVHRSMSYELHKLQVEEEMLMRKFYELMAAHGLTKKSEESANVSDDGEAGNPTALLCLPGIDQQ